MNLSCLTVVAIASVALFPSCDKGKSKAEDTKQPVATTPPATKPTPPTPTPKPKPTPTITKPFLWQVDKDGRTNYLLGTIHVGVSPDEFPTFVWDKFDSAKAFAMEVNQNEIDPAKMMQTLAGGKPLGNQLTDEEWKLFTAVMEMPKQTLAAMSSWQAILLFTAKAFEKHMLIKMDDLLERKAKGAKKSLHYLESLEAQLKALKQYATVQALKDSLTYMKAENITTVAALRAFSEKLLVAYRAGDDGMDFEKLMGPVSENLLEHLLYKRNRNWIPVLEKLFQNGPAFVAVGAAHLMGKNSVIELLQKRGYTIKRVTK